MSKHTPGPWVKCDRGDYGDFDGNSVVILGDNSCVRVAVVHHNGSDEHDANANLFFAAPEMLAELKGMQCLLARISVSSTTPHRIFLNKMAAADRVKVIDAIIAEAEGKSR